MVKQKLYPIVEATDISMCYRTSSDTIAVLKRGKVVIYDNTFNIVYGPSGSGKSTLLNILSGLQEPTSGIVEFEGDSIYKYHPDKLARFRAHRVGIVYQQNYWVKSLNVIENVSLPLYFLGYTKEQAAGLAEIALERVEMTEFAHKIPSLLSGGEQQRVAIARALVNDPKVVIADEPTGSLDSKSGDRVMDLLHKVKTEYRRTVILVTHNMEYLPLADRLFKIKDGEIEELESRSIKKATKLLLKETESKIKSLTEKRESNV